MTEEKLKQFSEQELTSIDTDVSMAIGFANEDTIVRMRRFLRLNFVTIVDAYKYLRSTNKGLQQNRELCAICQMSLEERRTIPNEHGGIAHIDALEAEIKRLKANPCPYVVTADEGTSFCRLAEGHVNKNEVKV